MSRLAPLSPASRKLLALASLLAASAASQAAVTISQVYGGGGNANATYSHDFVELRNTGSSAVSVQGWSLQYSSSTGTSWANQLTPLTGSIPANGFYLIRLFSQNAVGAALPTADAVGTTNMSGNNGKLALVNNSTGLPADICPVGASVVDSVGFGNANCSEGNVAAPVLSSTTAALRANAGCTDSNNNGADFSAALPTPRNSATTGTTACGGSGPGPDPDPVPLAAAIYTIQGSGAKSSMAGTLVVTSGVVTRQLNNGFFMQDLAGDGNPLTSDGILVFTGNNAYAAVAPGNLVTVVGTVTEFNTGAANNAGTAANTVTELASVSSVTLVSSGHTVTPVTVTLPEAQEGDLERYEGMLVRLTGPFTIQQNFFQGRYGQLTLAVGGRLETPTNRYRAGSAQAIALADENARRRILLDDGSSLQNPNPTPYMGAGGVPRAGDLVTSDIVGVIDYGLATNVTTGISDYKIHPTVLPSFALANLRTTAPDAVGGNVKVASFNVLNFFTTFTNGNTAGGQTGQGCTEGAGTSAGNCRGASNLNEFLRQRVKIVEAMSAIDADVVGLMEIQNNGNVAAQNLVDALNAKMGAGTYATVAVPAQGTGTDAIRVAMIYKPARLTLTAAAFSDPHPVNNRPTLAQTFALANGERFSVLVNHLKSKGSCPGTGDTDAAGNLDTGEGVGCWNALRKQQAQQLRTFVAQVQSAAASNDVLLIGDFNAYAQEDPMFELIGNGYVDQVGRFHPSGYSYVFDGAAGRLDAAVATASLSARTVGATHWHINADEASLIDYNEEFKAPNTNCGGLCPVDPYTATPYRSSDHDPVIVGLGLYKTITAMPGSTVLAGTAGDDILVAGAGRRTITGGAGRDQFVFATGFAGGATIADFQPGVDTISLAAVLKSLGVTSANPIGQGYLKCTAAGADATISIDPDAGGPAAPRAMLLIKNQGCSVLSAANFVN